MSAQLYRFMFQAIRKRRWQYPPCVPISEILPSFRRIPLARKVLVDACARYMDVSPVLNVGPYTLFEGSIPVCLSAGSEGEHILVPVSLFISDNWDSVPPFVRIERNYSWLKTGEDWHVSGDLFLCYELDRRWSDHFRDLMCVERDDIPDLAAQWIVNGVGHVLRVHLFCTRFGIDQWPRYVAPDWEHGEAGPQQYLEENIPRDRKKKKYDRKIQRRKRQAASDSIPQGTADCPR